MSHLKEIVNQIGNANKDSTMENSDFELVEKPKKDLTKKVVVECTFCAAKYRVQLNKLHFLAGANKTLYVYSCKCPNCNTKVYHYEPAEGYKVVFNTKNGVPTTPTTVRIQDGIEISSIKKTKKRFKTAIICDDCGESHMSCICDDIEDEADY